MKLKVHHQLLAMGLSPNELKVYCYLMVLRLSGQAESQSGAKLAALLYRLPAPAWPQRVSCPK